MVRPYSRRKEIEAAAEDVPKELPFSAKGRFGSIEQASERDIRAKDRAIEALTSLP